MSNLYTPPSAELIDDINQKNPVVRILWGTVACFLSVLLFAFAITLIGNRDLSLGRLLGLLVICSVTSLVVGFSLVLFRGLSLKKSVLMGIVLGPALLATVSLIIGFLVSRT